MIEGDDDDGEDVSVTSDGDGDDDGAVTGVTVVARVRDRVTRVCVMVVSS